MAKKIQKKNIIFDFDGVIINSHKVKTDAFYRIFQVYGKNYGLRAQRFHLSNTGKSRYYKFNFILKNILKINCTRKMINMLDRKFDDIVDTGIKKMYPSEYLIKFLKKNKNTSNYFISTGTPQKKILKILQEKKIYKYFKKIYGSPKSKINHIKDIKKNNNNRCIFIGDSYEDYRAAIKSNCTFILKINSENQALRKNKNLNRINSFKHLAQKLEHLNNL